MSSGQLREPCREWVASKGDRCNRDSEYILWGKLFPPEALGPRCYDHAVKYIGGGMSQLDQYAVYDLRRVHRLMADYRTLWGMTLGHDGQPSTTGMADDIERLRARFAEMGGTDGGN